MDIDTSCVSYYEEQLSHQVRTATARLSFSDAEEDDRDTLWMENIGNEDEDEYDSDHLSTDWEAVSSKFLLFIHIVECLNYVTLDKVTFKVSKIIGLLLFTVKPYISVLDFFQLCIV